MLDLIIDGGHMSDTTDGSCELILTNAQMRMADRMTIKQGQLSGVELMRRAAAEIAQSVIRCCDDGGRIVIVAGPGNNGGDGFMAAALLRKRNIPVTVVPLVPENIIQGDTAMMMASARKAGVKIRAATCHDDLEKLTVWLSRSTMVVDAIFGTGLTRPLAGWFGEAVKAINESDRDVFSIDIPSGIQGDDGRVMGVAVEADFTLPIAAYKWGHWVNEGRLHVGKLLPPASIGITDDTLYGVMESSPAVTAYSHLISRKMIELAFPAREKDAHKKLLGHLWVFGGSKGYTGAPRLAASGAQAVGAGLISIASPKEVYPIIASSSLEVMVHPQEHAPWQDADALVAGPGWGKNQVDKLADLLRSRLPVVVDADALNMLSGDLGLAGIVRRREAATVLTPHPGEAARLLDITPAEVQNDRLAAALAIAAKYRVWVVLKGPLTLLVSPDRFAWLSPFGSPNLAVAGTGDVLAGMIGGLLAAGHLAEIAIPAAVGLHGLAGEQQGWHRAGQLETIVAKLAENLKSRAIT